MSQKAWMTAYTKGSKSLQARLAKIHANNPEFQDFVKKHGFGGNLSVKQSGIQKKSSIGVQQTDKNAPTKGPVDREAMIKAAAEKLRDRRLAAHNRASFGGELGGGFSVPNMGFRTYREAVEESALTGGREPGRYPVSRVGHSHDSLTVRRGVNYGGKPVFVSKKMNKNYEPEEQARLKAKIKQALTKEATEKWKVTDKDDKHYTMKNAKGDSVRISRKVWDMKKGGVLHGSKSKRGTFRPTGLYMGEDVDYKGGDKLRMRKGGWIVVRNGKQHGIIHPTKEYAQSFSDATRASLATKLGAVIRKKAKEIAHGMGRMSLATESTNEDVSAGVMAAAMAPAAFGVAANMALFKRFGKTKRSLADRVADRIEKRKKPMKESAANRRRVRSWDSAIMPELKPLRVKPKSKVPFDADPPKKNPGVVVGKNDPNYSRARHLARLGLKKAMEKSNV